MTPSGVSWGHSDWFSLTIRRTPMSVTFLWIQISEWNKIGRQWPSNRWGLRNAIAINFRCLVRHAFRRLFWWKQHGKARRMNQGGWNFGETCKQPFHLSQECRSRVYTDQQGYYDFATVMPGWYKQPCGNYRPAHIYWKVTPINNTSYRTLTTQMYFKHGTPNLKNLFLYDFSSLLFQILT